MAANTSSTEPPNRLALGKAVPIASHFNPTGNTNASSSSTSLHTGSQISTLPSSSSLVNPTSLALSLPHSDHSVPISHVDIQALHYLCIEMPHILRNGVRRSARKRKQAIKQMQEAGMNVDFLSNQSTSQPQQQQQLNPHSQSEEDEDVIKRMEAIGAHIGASFVERLSRDKPPFPTTLDVLKFVCKELWTSVWEKQVDNLRTNHRGVYVLQDNVFKPLLRLSIPTQGPNGSKESALAIRLQLAMPIGIIRGALGRLGVASTVVAESNQVPQCTFHVKTTAPKS